MDTLPRNSSGDPDIRRLANVLRQQLPRNAPSATNQTLFGVPGQPPAYRRPTVNDVDFLASGAAAQAGTAVLVGGTKTVNTTAVAAGSRIMLTTQIPGGTVGAVYVSARVNGTSFTITSTSALDTSTVAWEIHQ